MQYSPAIFEPDTKKSVPCEPFVKLTRDEKMQKSLSNFDSTLLMDDLILLILNGTPRDKSNYYKHKTKHIYLYHQIFYARDIWTDVTQKFEWEKMMSNLDDPLWRYDKSYANREEDYIRYLEQKNSTDKVITKYTTMPHRFTVAFCDSKENSIQESKIGDFFATINSKLLDQALLRFTKP
jgi:hypothetical protein